MCRLILLHSLPVIFVFVFLIIDWYQIAIFNSFVLRQRLYLLEWKKEVEDIDLNKLGFSPLDLYTSGIRFVFQYFCGSNARVSYYWAIWMKKSPYGGLLLFPVDQKWSASTLYFLLADYKNFKKKKSLYTNNYGITGSF